MWEYSRIIKQLREVIIMSVRQIRRGATLIGYFQDIPGGVTQVRDASNRLKGWYDSKSDTTRTSSGSYYANGNCAAELLNR